MLGDTAVCVHPTDERYKHLIGKTVTIPLVDREIPIIADGLLADPTLGTGCVKVTPAHDPNDYACWPAQPEIADDQHPQPRRHDQRERRQVRRAWTATRPAKPWSTDMEALGLFEGKEDRDIPLKYSDRSKTPIEPYLSDQWFVKMGDRDDGKPGLAQMAMDAVTDGPGEVLPGALRQDVPRLARREARLVHQPAAVVGASHSDLVRKHAPRGASLKKQPSREIATDRDRWQTATRRTTSWLIVCELRRPRRADAQGSK